MIETRGLSKRQQALYDIIWNMDEWEQVEGFMKCLSKRDRIDCEGIIELIKLAIIEEFSETRKYKEANELINKVK
jgi:hypothetical protein